jgi:predicted RNA-binding Zn ribbon-like protein
MTIDKDIATIPLRGGHPALDFVNTVDAWRDRWGPDFLGHYEDLVAWAERRGLIERKLADVLRAESTRAPAVAEVALLKAKTLRGTLRSLFLSETAGHAADAADAKALNSILQQAGQHRELRQEADSFIWDWRDEINLETITNRVALAAAEFLAARLHRRNVRECHGANCGWLFLDTSRAGRRLWCSEESCGTSMRVRRFRDKTRSSQPA